ncbi:unnamed protein product [Ilex paraguariensis]|uniref:EF-hand domain-containing protein n=1 Tax=Ilex paraguariensis TaxID=185542 RepID=A0ABC8STH6_9AQUA
MAYLPLTSNVEPEFAPRKNIRALRLGVGEGAYRCPLSPRGSRQGGWGNRGYTVRQFFHIEKLCTSMASINTSDLHRIFEKLDQNGDGLVSLDELKWLLEKIGLHTSLDEVELSLGKTSLDAIDFLFFYDAVIKGNVGESKEGEESNNLETDLVEAFKIYDLDGDGFISCEELQSVLSRLGLWDEHCGRDCKSMINVYDANSDGVIDFEEFKNMMLLTNL